MFNIPSILSKGNRESSASLPMVPSLISVHEAPKQNCIRVHIEDSKTFFACIDVVMWIKNKEFSAARNLYHVYKNRGQNNPTTVFLGKFPEMYAIQAYANDAKLRYTDFVEAEELDLLIQIMGPEKRQQPDGYVYLIQCCWPYYDHVFKIGITNNLKKRLIGISQTVPFIVALISYAKVSNPRQLEMNLHAEFNEQRVKGEWFALSSDQLEQVLTRLATAHSDEKARKINTKS